MQTLSYEKASEVHKVFFELFPDLYPVMRRVAAERLVSKGFDEVGSSDTSIELTEMFRSFEVPFIGPLLLAYERCGVNVEEN